MRKQPIHIVGAGMAGLLAGNMMRGRKPIVYETAPALPHNHSAVLRFRSNVVGDVLNIPFKRVTMIKDRAPWHSPVADALAYSFKCGGTMRTDRSIIDGLSSGERFIAPDNLIALMADGLDINFGHKYTFATCIGGAKIPAISTIPMPLLMKALDYPGHDHIDFNYTRGWNVRCKVKHCDAYATVYVPDPAHVFSRVSITGDELIVEIPRDESVKAGLSGQELAEEAAEFLGISAHMLSDFRLIEQKYAKILPIEEGLRKDFIHWATDKHSVFALGRFATWRPGLLLDDLVHDVRLIDRWLSDRYAAARHR